MPKIIKNKLKIIANELIEKFVVAMPEEWMENAEKIVVDREPLHCESWDELIGYWEKAMYWNQNLQYGLSCMLATVASTMSIGDQLWMRIISPPASGKSTLAEALSLNKKYCLAKSTIRGFHSGFGDGKEDFSLASQISGKTLITKDGDTLMQSPNLSQILAEGRDVYDTVSRTSYRNANSKDYEGLRATWLLCGTDSLRGLDESELGERFLDCIIMKDIDSDLEQKILWSIAARVDVGMGIESSKERGQQQSDELEAAHRRTAGYINYLRENAIQGMKDIVTTDEQRTKIIKYALYIAFMRARPSSSQKETASRELATRLTSQLMRLTLSTAFVQQRSVDEIMHLVRRSAADTADGLTTHIVDTIQEQEDRECNLKTLCSYLQMDDKELKPILRFLIKIKAIREKCVRLRSGVIRSRSYILTKQLNDLWEIVNDKS